MHINNINIASKKKRKYTWESSKRTSLDSMLLAFLYCHKTPEMKSFKKRRFMLAHGSRALIHADTRF